MENLYYSVPAFSLTPSKLVLYSKNFKRSLNSNTPYDPFVKNGISRRISNLQKSENGKISRFHNFQISIQARKNLFDKINWLYFMSKSRHKKTVSGKDIYNFRINFITLTLPSKQEHNTATITNECFNQFLTELREKYNLENYVWRLEFQKNGNVHYHLVTDVYLDYYVLLKNWNRILSKLGYVQKYAEKHSLMSLSDYVKEYSNNNKIDFEVLKKRYIKGKALKWKVPNTVDVKSVLGQKKIAFYISKYFGKGSEKGPKKNVLDNEENSKGLRLWFCSRSLSKLKKIVDFVPAFDIDLISLISGCKDVFKIIHDYCTVFYYSASLLTDKAKSIVNKLLRQYAISLDYKPAI